PRRADLRGPRAGEGPPRGAQARRAGRRSGVPRAAQRGLLRREQAAQARGDLRMKRDRATDIGIVVVGLAAAVLTFTTLRDLAEACGIDGALVGDWVPLSWLVPITI